MTCHSDAICHCVDDYLNLSTYECGLDVKFIESLNCINYAGTLIARTQFSAMLLKYRVDWAAGTLDKYRWAQGKIPGRPPGKIPGRTPGSML